MIDYEEYYKISENDYNLFHSNPAMTVDFVEQCKKRKKDDLLIVTPGAFMMCSLIVTVRSF